MSLKQKIDFECDSCGKQHSLKGEMELPPKWIGIQLAIADNNGVILKQEQERFSHFCSIECLIDFVKSEELRERILLSDVKLEDEDEDENENKEEENDEENNNYGLSK